MGDDVLGGKSMRIDRGIIAVALAGVLLAGAAGCTGTAEAGENTAGQGAGTSASPSPAAPATVTAPKNGATKVSVLAAVSIGGVGNDPVTVAVKAGSANVAGSYNASARQWQAKNPLAWGTKYAVTVTTHGAGGVDQTSTSRFTTLAKPANMVNVSSYLDDGQVVGVGMPLMIKFGRPIPTNLRAAVERKMTVTTSPRQVGSWHWFSGTDVHYRPKTYWKAATTIAYKVDVRGVALGGGWYGNTLLSVKVKTGRAVTLEADAKTHQMVVKRDGKVLRKIPVSMGKPSTPSSSGTMVIMGKYDSIWFDTRKAAKKEDRYHIKVYDAQRLTWGGEFIHAAGWSEWAQGNTNVSHGCINVSVKNAKWLMGITTIGTPVLNNHTGVKLEQGNGWTDWNIPWKQWVAGSAL